MIFLTAWLTGLLSSLHCVGMCGPIALATPTIGQSKREKWFGKLVYNVGRIFTYSVLGAVFGLFGAGLKIAGWQQGVSITVGILMLIVAVLNSSWIEQYAASGITKFTSRNIGVLFQRKTYTALWLIGVLNGLLPCGFVYLALLGAISTQSFFQGVFFMALFGLGTLPLMYAVSLFGVFMSTSLRTKTRKLMPYFMFALGIVFILRGLNLGVSYLSPKIETPNQVSSVCGDSSHFQTK